MNATASLSSSPPHAMVAVRVHAVRAEACDVLSLDLRPLDGGELPAFTAGSHIDVELPVAGGSPLLRQYSLCNDSAERHRYVIGVGRDAASRGGSAFVHARVRAGDTLRIGAPRNNFALDESAPHSVLVAGGIGITPLLAMARRLAALGRPWTLYLCARSPARAAFVDELLALGVASNGAGRVVTVFDGMPGTPMLDLAAVVRDAPAGAHFYCCGPAPMLRAFQAATRDCGDERVHVEWFAPPAAPALPDASGTEDRAATEGRAPGEASGDSFTVQLKRKNRNLTVPPDKSILEVLLAAGIDVDYSCREGLCGTCETRVLAGTPEHRDPIFAGRKSPPTDRMLVCVSRCKGDELVLDL